MQDSLATLIAGAGMLAFERGRIRSWDRADLLVDDDGQERRMDREDRGTVATTTRQAARSSCVGSTTIGLGRGCESLHFARTSYERVRHVVASVLSLARQVIDDVDDPIADLLIAVGRQRPNCPGGICEAVADFRGCARDEPQGEARSHERP